MSRLTYPKNHCSLAEYGGPDVEAFAIQQTMDYPIRPFRHFRVWIWDAIVHEFRMVSGPDSFQSHQEAFHEAAQRLNAGIGGPIGELVRGYGGATFRLADQVTL